MYLNKYFCLLLIGLCLFLSYYLTSAYANDTNEMNSILEETEKTSSDRTDYMNRMMKLMDKAEKSFNDQQKKKVLAIMDLDNMFPDPQIRALAKAAGKGKVSKIEKIVSQGVSVNGRGAKNATPLFWALRKQSFKGFKKLLELGADPNILFDDGGTVMHWVADDKFLKFLQAALEHGGDPNLIACMFAQSPLFDAIDSSSEISKTPAMDLLLKAGANINKKNSFGNTPVLHAAESIRFDIVYKLLQHGADYRLRNYHDKDLADIMVSEKKRMDLNHEFYSVWYKKVKSFLIENGVTEDRFNF